MEKRIFLFLWVLFFTFFPVLRRGDTVEFIEVAVVSCTAHITASFGYSVNCPVGMLLDKLHRVFEPQLCDVVTGCKTCKLLYQLDNFST